MSIFHWIFVVYGVQCIIIVWFMIFSIAHTERRRKSRERYLQWNDKTVPLEKVLSGGMNIFKICCLAHKYGYEVWILTSQETIIDSRHIIFDKGYKILPEPNNETIRKICCLYNCESSATRLHSS